MIIDYRFVQNLVFYGVSQNTGTRKKYFFLILRKMFDVF
jgi:hypothetical protein